MGDGPDPLVARVARRGLAGALGERLVDARARVEDVHPGRLREERRRLGGEEGVLHLAKVGDEAGLEAVGRLRERRDDGLGRLVDDRGLRPERGVEHVERPRLERDDVRRRVEAVPNLFALGEIDVEIGAGERDEERVAGVKLGEARDRARALARVQRQQGVDGLVGVVGEQLDLVAEPRDELPPAEGGDVVSRRRAGAVLAVARRDDRDLHRAPVYPGPRTNRPGRASVCSPSRRTAVPLTKTWTMPVAS